MADRPKAGRFAAYLEGREALLVSAIELGLAMADSLVYATARRFGATLVTGEADFEGLPDTIVVR